MRIAALGLFFYRGAKDGVTRKTYAKDAECWIHRKELIATRQSGPVDSRGYFTTINTYWRNCKTKDKEKRL